jgi:hypothetical protein
MVYMMMSTRNFTYCHDPYAFAAYANAQGYGTLLVNTEDKPEDDQLSTSTSSASIEVSSDATSDEEVMPKPRPVIVGPCGHTEIRRLRFKKGLSHYLCTCCGTKWKQGHN